MSSKHVFDSADGLVLKALRGAVALNPVLRIHTPSKTVYVASSSTPVAIISGGGAGHEPAHASYTGAGMLTASVSGDIFASPSSSQILSAIELACAVSPSVSPVENQENISQVLLIINNYTGDRLNFGLAAEKARAQGILIDSVVVADDVSLLSEPTLVGPRGLGGNILVCKILGAAAAQGGSLSQLKRIGDAVVANLASIGVGLDHCHVPGREKKSDNGMKDDECELGMGLHNEPGVKRMQMTGPEALIGDMINLIISSRERKAFAQNSSKYKEFFKFSEEGGKVADDVVLYLNNLGGMSQLEMGAILDETLTQLERKRIYPARIYLSSFMTSLNAPGFSISLLNVSSVIRDLQASNASEYTFIEDILQLLDAPTDALAWIGVRVHWSEVARDRGSEEREAELLLASRHSRRSKSMFVGQDIGDQCSSNSSSEANEAASRIKDAIKAACESVLAVESDLTKFDTIVGDGDCGETFSSGAKAVLKSLESDALNVTELKNSELIERLGNILESSMGGTSGALFGIYFTSLSVSLRTLSWKEAALHALASLSQYTPARLGDRTIIDALQPFCSELEKDSSVKAAAQSARAGAEGTRGMRARLGRATYVGVTSDEAKELPPDPGAWGVAALLEGLAQVVE